MQTRDLSVFAHDNTVWYVEPFIVVEPLNRHTLRIKGRVFSLTGSQTNRMLETATRTRK